MKVAEERQVSIAQWLVLVQNGTVLPMCIPLQGDSMRPLIRRSRDLVYIVPLMRLLKRGDVVLYESTPGTYVTHRVRRTKDRYVQTLGDYCWKPDPWISSKSVLGVAVMVERNGARIPLDNFFARVLGCVWMAGLPLRRGYWRCRAMVGKFLRRIGWRR